MDRLDHRGLVNMIGKRGPVSPRAYGIMLVLARGWLIERARTKRLRAELDAYEGSRRAQDKPRGLHGPDICTAALAAVRALEDGESK